MFNLLNPFVMTVIDNNKNFIDDMAKKASDLISLEVDTIILEQETNNSLILTEMQKLKLKMDMMELCRKSFKISRELLF